MGRHVTCALVLAVLGAPPSVAGAGWQVVAPGGETRCADGSPYRFFVHAGDPEKLLVEFEGGGACWDASTCARPIFTRRVEVDPGAARRLGAAFGIGDRANPANPFRDYTHLYVPYCTGDLHWGAVSRTYDGPAGPFTVEHRGAVNAAAALRWAFEHVRAPSQVFVTGCSAGGYGSIFWAPRVFARYPGVTAAAHLADSAAGVAPEGFFATPWASWNVAPAWATEADTLGVRPADPARVTMVDLYARAAAAFPAAVFSQWNANADPTQAFFWGLARGAAGPVQEWSAAMSSSLQAVRAQSPNFAAYVAPGAHHCVINTPSFYTTTVNGVLLVDWVRGLLATRSPRSVP